MSTSHPIPRHPVLLSTGARATVAGYCAHLLLLWIDGYDRLVGFGPESH